MTWPYVGIPLKREGKILKYVERVKWVNMCSWEEAIAYIIERSDPNYELLESVDELLPTQTESDLVEPYLWQEE